MRTAATRPASGPARPSRHRARRAHRAAAALLAAGLASLAGCAHTPPPRKEVAGDPVVDAAANAVPRWRTIGLSVQGRPLRVATFGTGPRRVLWVGSIHGNEDEGRVATQELPHAFLAIPDAARDVTLTILENANPDGLALDVRGNANGVDLNRNFPSENFKPHRMFGISPLSQPEAKALHDLILELEPHLVIVAHSWRGDHFINFDGPAAELAQRFSALSGYRVRESGDFAATPGSLGSWVGHTLGIPILTLEYERGREEVAAWLETRAAILDVVLDR